MKDLPVLIDAIIPRDKILARLGALRRLVRGRGGEVRAMGPGVAPAGDPCSRAASARSPGFAADRQPCRSDTSVAAAMSVAPGRV